MDAAGKEGLNMTKLRVGLRTGQSVIINIQKPFDYITSKDVEDIVGGSVIGWVWVRDD